MWWTSQDAGYIGAAIGILGGLFGTVVGLSGAMLKSTRAYTLVKYFIFAFAALGAAALLAGVYALIRSQPYHVFYPLLLAGGIFSILPIALLPALRNRLRVMEQRRMESAALRNG
jgi:hypothetical protein